MQKVLPAGVFSYIPVKSGTFPHLHQPVSPSRHATYGHQKYGQSDLAIADNRSPGRQIQHRIKAQAHRKSFFKSLRGTDYACKRRRCFFLKRIYHLLRRQGKRIDHIGQTGQIHIAWPAHFVRISSFKFSCFAAYALQSLTYPVTASMASRSAS